MRKGLAVFILLLSGCDMYFGGGGDDDDVCNYGTGGGVAQPAYQVRDPNTGICQYGGGGGGDWCDNPCEPCPATGAGAALPDWGMCYGKCSGLDEASCYGATGCYAAYLDDPAADGKREFWGCWETAPSGPVQGTCTNLDAQSCSRHDNCIAIYSGVTDSTGTAYPGTSFLQCAVEPTTPCNGQNPCPVACEMLTTESSCKLRNDCQPVYDGSDCTCYPSGCSCQVLTYDRCETL